MPEQQPPFNIEPSDILFKAIENAMPHLILLAMIFIPLIMFKKWADAKLKQRNKRGYKQNNREREPGLITVMCLLIKKMYCAWQGRKKNKTKLPDSLPEWRYPPNDALYRNTPQTQQTSYEAVDYSIFDLEDDEEEEQVYFPREILTKAEFAFFATLQNICRNYFYIIPKMGLWALVDSRDNMTAWNKISRKHLDFTLCHPETMKPLLVIELDDSSHRNPKQRLRDLEKDAILKEVGVPVLRIPVARKYDEGAIRNLISGKIKRN